MPFFKQADDDYDDGTAIPTYKSYRGIFQSIHNKSLSLTMNNESRSKRVAGLYRPILLRNTYCEVRDKIFEYF